MVMTDPSSLFYQGSPPSSAVEDDDVLSVCVRVCVLFPDLELIPFKTLLNTSGIDLCLLTPHQPPPPPPFNPLHP